MNVAWEYYLLGETEYAHMRAAPLCYILAYVFV